MSIDHFLFFDEPCVDSAGDKSVIIWSVDTGQQLARLEGHSRYVTSVAFSPDGRLLASGSNDLSVIVWGLAGQPFDGTSVSSLDAGQEAPGSSTGCNNRQNVGRRFSANNFISGAVGGAAIETAAANQMNGSIIDWSVEQVVDWLKSIQLDELEGEFRRQQIDGTELLHLT